MKRDILLIPTLLYFYSSRFTCVGVLLHCSIDAFNPTTFSTTVKYFQAIIRHEMKGHMHCNNSLLPPAFFLSFFVFMPIPRSPPTHVHIRVPVAARALQLVMWDGVKESLLSTHTQITSGLLSPWQRAVSHAKWVLISHRECKSWPRRVTSINTRDLTV